MRLERVHPDNQRMHKQYGKHCAGETQRGDVRIQIGVRVLMPCHHYFDQSWCRIKSGGGVGRRLASDRLIQFFGRPCWTRRTTPAVSMVPTTLPGIMIVMNIITLPKPSVNTTEANNAGINKTRTARTRTRVRAVMPRPR